MQDSNMRSIACVVANSLLSLMLTGIFVSPVAAHDDDHKRLPSQKMKLRSDPTNPSHARFIYKTKNQVRIADLSSVDPRVAGATLTIRGTGANDGDTGVIHLPDGPQGRWSPIGGDKGWQYKHGADFNDSNGITTVKIKENAKKGGSLLIKGKGQYLNYDILDEQAEVEILLSIGTDVYCAQYGADSDEFRRNETGKVDGKASAPPADCSVACGNAILELGEECDDGDTDDSDTCSNECAGCLPQDVEFNTTFEGIQALIFDSPLYQCSNDACHGSTLSGDLDLRAGSSYAQLVNTPAMAPSNGLRIFPGDQALSFLYNKIAAKTLGTPQNVGTPMPSNAETVTEEHLEALRLWIRGGAQETGVVAGTAELFGSCLPAASPLKIPQPDPPVNGVQFSMPGYDLPTQSETELCVASYFDLTSVVDPDAVLPCPPGMFEGTNPSGNCFASNSMFLAQDPQSHHSLIYMYNGEYDWDDAGWGSWTCYLGDNDGQACDPTTADPCPGGGVCGGTAQETVGCINYGPADYSQNNVGAVRFGGSQESTFLVDFPTGVYQLLPLQGVIVWNSHAFNLTNDDMNMEAWLNLDYAGSADQTFVAQQLFNATKIFVQDVLPFQQEEYCYTHTFPEGSRLFELTSHTHKYGKRWRYYSAPQTPCPLNGPCNPGSPGDIFYESTDYSDPLQILFDPAWHFTGTDAARTIKFCSLYDNGASDEAEVKTRSGSPCPPIGCGAPIGGPCGTASMFPKDPRNTTIYCLDGPNQGQLCQSDVDCPLSVCDACRVLGGVTTEDEMFIAIGTYYID